MDVNTSEENGKEGTRQKGQETTVMNEHASESVTERRSTRAGVEGRDLYYRLYSLLGATMSNRCANVDRTGDEESENVKRKL